MFRPTDGSPLFLLPHMLQGCGEVRIRGRGQLIVRLRGEGHLKVVRDPQDDLTFEGRGLLRHVSGGLAHLGRGEGVLTMSRSRLDFEFHGGGVEIVLRGHFDVLAIGLGTLHCAQGQILAWSRVPRPWRIDGAVAGAAA